MTKREIYRGFIIEIAEDGTATVKTEDGETLSNKLSTAEKAYQFIDAHKRRGGA